MELLFGDIVHTTNLLASEFEVLKCLVFVEECADGSPYARFDEMWQGDFK
jgi:hypothetical protein